MESALIIITKSRFLRSFWTKVKTIEFLNIPSTYCIIMSWKFASTLYLSLLEAKKSTTCKVHWQSYWNLRKPSKLTDIARKTITASKYYFYF